MPGIRRNTETTIVVSSNTLPVAGIYFLAAFLDDLAQLRTFRLGKDFSTTGDGGKALFAICFAKTMNILSHLRQLGRGQRLEIFNDYFQRAHWP